jgi:hypothetical protein
VEIAQPPQTLVDLILKWHARQSNGADNAPRKAAPTIAALVPHGQRYRSLLSLAGTMRRRGLVAEEMVPSLKAVAERRFQPVPGDEIDVEAIAAGVCKYEPADPVLVNPIKLGASVRDMARAHLHPAIRRAQDHAVEHRAKARRQGR